MDLMDHFNRQLDYDAWANREVLVSLKALDEPPASCIRLLSHVVAAEHVWLTRLIGRAATLAVWPNLSLGSCEEWVRDLQVDFRSYFQRELPAALDRNVTYKNSKGEEWSNRVEDILTHVFMHSAYHRGQIAMQTRQAGHVPAYTDFIHGVRQGLVR